MIKGNRIEATNANAVGTSTTVYNMISIPTGKTFILTDLVLAATYGADDPIGLLSNQIFKLYDFIGSGGTAASGNATAKLNVHIPQVQLGTAYTSGLADETPTFQHTGVVMHFTNGPEFTTGVTPGMGGAANSQVIGTGCVWLAGILR